MQLSPLGKIGDAFPIGSIAKLALFAGIALSIGLDLLVAVPLMRWQPQWTTGLLVVVPVCLGIALVLLSPWLAVSCWLTSKRQKVPAGAHAGLAALSVFAISTAAEIPRIVSRWDRLPEVLYPSAAQREADLTIEMTAILAVLAALSVFAVFLFRKALRLELVL